MRCVGEVERKKVSSSLDSEGNAYQEKAVPFFILNFIKQHSIIRNDGPITQLVRVPDS